MNKTAIEWTDFTWNPVTGCTKVSAGCKNCYAESMFGRFEKKWGKFENVTFHPDRLNQVDNLKPGTKVFVNSMSDLFHEKLEYREIEAIIKKIETKPDIIFQVLTKRPQRAWGFFDIYNKKIPDNLWLGVSVENQMTADLRIPILKDIDAKVKFLSCEPLLEKLDLEKHLVHWNHEGEPICYIQPKPIDWVIVGGESGKNARPVNPAWVRDIKQQCELADIPFFFKQWGEWKEIPFYIEELLDSLHIFINFSFQTIMQKVGKKKAGSLLDGKEHKEFPRGGNL